MQLTLALSLQELLSQVNHRTFSHFCFNTKEDTVHRLVLKV